MTPTGRFGIAHAPDDARIHVGFAAGSGITPILSIVRGVLAREPQSQFFLFYGNRVTDGILFREVLEELKDRYMISSREARSAGSSTRSFADFSSAVVAAIVIVLCSNYSG